MTCRLLPEKIGPDIIRTRHTALNTPETGLSTTRFTLFPPPDTRFDEAVDVAVEDSLRIADLVLGAKVFHHLVRLDYIRPHLVAPGIAAVGFEGVHFGFLRPATRFQETGLKYPYRGGTVL